MANPGEAGEGAGNIVAEVGGESKRKAAEGGNAKEEAADGLIPG